MKANRSWPGVPNRYITSASSTVIRPKSMATVVVVFAPTREASSTSLDSFVIAASVVSGGISDTAATNVVFPTPNPPATTSLTDETRRTRGTARSSRGLPTVCTIVSMRSDVSAARVRPPVITNGRTKSCGVPRGGSSWVIERLSLEHVLLQLRDERRTECGADSIDEQRHLIPDRADITAAIRHDTERAAVRYRRHE